MEKYSPLVSVIIPAYNEEKYIEKTLKSIINQSYHKIEIIVVDNNSRDRTKVIAKKYAHKVIVERVRSISAARNCGAKEAKGEILLFIDADTEIEKNFVKKIIHKLSDKKVVCVSGFIKTKGKLLHRFYYWLWSNIIWLLSIFKIYQFPGIAFAIKKEIFSKVNGFNKSLKSSEDVDLCERVSEYGKCIFLRDAVAYSSSRKLEKMGFWHAIIFWLKNYLEFKIKKVTENDYPVIR